MSIDIVNIPAVYVLAAATANVKQLLHGHRKFLACNCSLQTFPESFAPHVIYLIQNLQGADASTRYLQMTAHVIDLPHVIYNYSLLISVSFFQRVAHVNCLCSFITTAIPHYTAACVLIHDKH